MTITIKKQNYKFLFEIMRNLTDKLMIKRIKNIQYFVLIKQKFFYRSYTLSWLWGKKQMYKTLIETDRTVLPEKYEHEET